MVRIYKYSLLAVFLFCFASAKAGGKHCIEKKILVPVTVVLEDQFGNEVSPFTDYSDDDDSLFDQDDREEDNDHCHERENITADFHGYFSPSPLFSSPFIIVNGPGGETFFPLKDIRTHISVFRL